MRPTLDFWFEFASTYSYLSAVRIERAADAAGVSVRWQPFLLGPIFKAQGWSTSPFNIYPAKGRYMVRDIERIAASRGLAFHLPAAFPANGLLAARVALALRPHDMAAFVPAVYRAQFADGQDISDAQVLSDILRRLGADADACLASAGSDDIKAQLKQQSARAAEIGLFGAPAFVTADGEVFWGDDRLDQALTWARTGRVA